MQLDADVEADRLRAMRKARREGSGGGGGGEGDGVGAELFSASLPTQDREDEDWAAGLMQGDWKLTHILRSADKGGLRVIDFSHASMHNASLPSGANWCVYTSLQLYASRLNDKWLRAAPERCLLRCLLGLGQHSGVLSKETAASIFGARQLATNRHCRQILETVLHMADAGPPATAAEPRRLQPGCSTRATRTHFEMVRHVLDEANRAWGEQHTRK